MLSCLRLIGICLGLSCWSVLAYAEPQSAKVLSSKHVELKAVRSKISESTKNLGQLHEQQEFVQQQLAEIDKKYAHLVLSLKTLEQQVEDKKQTLNATRSDINKQQQQINEHKHGLAEQVKAAHRMGRRDRIKLLLNQEDPALSSRMLVYYDYFNKVRVQKVAQIDREVKQLVQLEHQLQQDELQLNKLLKQKQIDQAALLETKQARTVLLAQLDKQYRSDQEALQHLQNDERQLVSLLAVLQKEVERQRLQDEAQAKAEKAKKALEAARIQSKQQQLAQAAELKRLAKIEAKTKRLAQSKEHASVHAKQEQVAIAANEPDKAKVNKPEKRDNPVVKGSHFVQLRGRLPWPVRGKVRKSFERAGEGVLISAVAGQNVQAVASGRVVYAAWLRGYGLLMIVNHGDGYMTVYAFNESLYKGVGAFVSAGEVIASAGQSGGRASPALYFEIRHQGKPLDPVSWCKK